nr:MAG TPA: hypothetical protein [Caudoviricetes sp.]
MFFFTIPIPVFPSRFWFLTGYTKISFSIWKNVYIYTKFFIYYITLIKVERLLIVSYKNRLYHHFYKCRALR